MWLGTDRPKPEQSVELTKEKPLISQNRPPVVDLLITTGIPFYNGGREEVFATMQIEIKMDAAYAEPKVIVLTAEMTEEVTRLVQSSRRITRRLFPAAKLKGSQRW